MRLERMNKKKREKIHTQCHRRTAAEGGAWPNSMQRRDLMVSSQEKEILKGGFPGQRRLYGLRRLLRHCGVGVLICLHTGRMNTDCKRCHESEKVPFLIFNQGNRNALKDVFGRVSEDLKILLAAMDRLIVDHVTSDEVNLKKMWLGMFLLFCMSYKRRFIR